MSNFERTTLTESEIDVLWAVFGPPPVLSSENKEAYNALRNAYVAHYRATNIRVLWRVRQLLDTEWEMFRWLRYRTEAIKRHHQYRMRK